MGLDFTGIWGQKRALETLARNFANARIASAYLFAGPRGTGKTTTALLFAKALLCRGAGSAPCGACKSCVMFDAGNHPDFARVAPEGVMIKVEQVRDVIAALSLKSYMGGKKVCLIEDADAMNRSTANAFLKTLEEPPGDTAIIIISSNPSALLPTIVSRCRVVRFVPMPPEELAPLLEKERGLAPAEALTLARLSEGCPGAALGDDMDRMKTIDDEAQKLAAALPGLAPEDAVRFAEGWKKRRNDLPALLDRLMEAFRAVARSVPGASSDTISPVMAAYGRFPAERATDCYETALAARPRLVFNPNVQLFLESLIFSLQLALHEGSTGGTESD